MEPIFIAGCGRSGTTYLRTLLDAHPEIYIPTESLFLVDYFKYGEYVPEPIMRWFFFREPQLRAWYSGDPFQIHDIGSAVASIHEYEAQQNKARFWGQKTPRFIRYMELFEKYLPDIKWILVYRDPRAVVASMKNSSRHTYSIDRACKRWLKDNQKISDISSKRKPDNVMIISYENLVTHFEKITSQVFQFVGLSPLKPADIFEKGQVKRIETSKFEVNAIRDSLSPQKRTITAWKEQLTQDQIAEIESKCSHMMKILGYQFVTGKRRPDLKNSFTECLNKLKDVFILLEYLRKWPYYLIHTACRKMVFFLCQKLRIDRRS